MGSGEVGWVGLARHLASICALKLPVVLWYPCLQLCLKDPQFYLLQTDLLFLPGEKSSREFWKGSRNLPSSQQLSTNFLLFFHFQRYLEPPDLLRVLSFSSGGLLIL